jgi:hypothetical protein
MKPGDLLQIKYDTYPFIHFELELQDNTKLYEDEFVIFCNESKYNYIYVISKLGLRYIHIYWIKNETW